MIKPPSPIFTFFGIEGGATCSCLNNGQLLVGSQNGMVQAFGLESKIMEHIVYVDEEERRIQSIEISGNDTFVYIRSYAVLQLRKPEMSKSTWKVIRTIEVDHVGFCNFLILQSQLLFASTDDKRYAKLCWTEIKDESIPTKSNRILDEADVNPMCMLVGEEKENEVLIGMEDGRLAICYGDNGMFECQAKQKLGRDPIFCIASSSKWVAAGCARAPIYLLNRYDLSKQEIPYPPDAAGCSAISFSPNSKQIIAGFWDGSIRVFSRHRLNVLLALTNAHSSTISSIIWLPPEQGEIVIATSSDSTVSLWKLK